MFKKYSSIIVLFAILALINLAQSQEDVSSSRRLGYYKGKGSRCAKALDLTDRCCGDDLSACKCPVRGCTKWYCGWIQRSWNHKCEAYEEYAASQCNIPAIADDAGVFNTLLAALGAAGLDGVLSGEGPFTVFAPDDDAFAALGDIVPCLLEEDNIPVLTDILLYHVVSGTVLSTDLSDGLTAPTLLGQNITVHLTDGVKINNSTVTAADTMASNGVIHKLDSVLIPPIIDLSACVAA